MASATKRATWLLALVTACLGAFTWSLPESRAERTRCGPNDCGKDEACCNYGCGICVPKTGVHACIQPLCYWGSPNSIDPVHRPSTDVYDRVHSRVAVNAIEERRNGFTSLSLFAVSAAVGAQHYIREKTAVRAEIAGTQLGDGDFAPGGQTRGLALSAGASYRPTLSTRRRIIEVATVFDTELSLGPNPQPALAPMILTDLRVTSLAAGIVLADGFNVVPASAHLRYVHSLVEGGQHVGYLDVGIAVSASLHWLQIPLGVRVAYRFADEMTGGDYRAHELDGGLYYLKKRRLRLGLDVGTVSVRIAPTLSTRTTRAVVRLAWHWDANA